MDLQHPNLTKKLRDAGMMMWCLKIVLVLNQKKALLLLMIAFAQIFTESSWINI